MQASRVVGCYPLVVAEPMKHELKNARGKNSHLLMEQLKLYLTLYVVYILHYYSFYYFLDAVSTCSIALQFAGIISIIVNSRNSVELFNYTTSYFNSKK